MKRLSALLLLLALLPAATRLRPPAAEKPKQLDGNAVISLQRASGRSSSG